MTSVVERIRICKALDVDAALDASPYTPPGEWKANGRWADTREIALASLHKVRVAQRGVYTKAERAESKQWLLDNGWSLPGTQSNDP